MGVGHFTEKHFIIRTSYGQGILKIGHSIEDIS